MNVIIADRNSKAREALEALLRAQPGMNVIAEAAEANGLVELVSKHVVDVIILDYRLPGIPLAELIHQIRMINQFPKVIVMSSDPENARFALNSGADFYVSKSDQPEWLLEILRGFEKE